MLQEGPSRRRRYISIWLNEQSTSERRGLQQVVASYPAAVCQPISLGRAGSGWQRRYPKKVKFIGSTGHNTHHSPGTIMISAGLVYFPSKTPLSQGAHELRLSATTKLIISALILSLHLRPRDRLNGGIHPRHYQMAPTSYIHKITEPAALTRSIAVHTLTQHRTGRIETRPLSDTSIVQQVSYRIH